MRYFQNILPLKTLLCHWHLSDQNTYTLPNFEEIRSPSMLQTLMIRQKERPLTGSLPPGHYPEADNIKQNWARKEEFNANHR